MNDRERNQAIKEAHNIAASQAYFGARSMFPLPAPHTIFDAGFSRGWDAGRAAIEAHESDLREENERLRKQLPEGMQDCTIQFIQCDKGHGRLTATNWVQHGCPTCTLEAHEAHEAWKVPDGFVQWLKARASDSYSCGVLVKDALSILASAPPAPQAIAPELDVRKIMLDVVPGFDGMGEEVYATCVADVEAVLGKMGEELGDWRLGIKRHPAPPAPQASVVKPEPVMIYHGRCVIDCNEHGHQDVEMLKMIPAGSLLYTHPAPVREPLTPERINSLWDSHTVPAFGRTGINPIVFARAIEAAACAERDDHIEHLERVLVQARDWVAERPEDRKISAGKLVAAIDEALK